MIFPRLTLALSLSEKSDWQHHSYLAIASFLEKLSSWAWTGGGSSPRAIRSAFAAAAARLCGDSGSPMKLVMSCLRFFPDAGGGSGLTRTRPAKLFFPSRFPLTTPFLSVRRRTTLTLTLSLDFGRLKMYCGFWQNFRFSFPDPGMAMAPPAVSSSSPTTQLPS